jgi:hypothetical protein
MKRGSASLLRAAVGTAGCEDGWGLAKPAESKRVKTAFCEKNSHPLLKTSQL